MTRVTVEEQLACAGEDAALASLTQDHQAPAAAHATHVSGSHFGDRAEDAGAASGGCAEVGEGAGVVEAGEGVGEVVQAESGVSRGRRPGTHLTVLTQDHQEGAVLTPDHQEGAVLTQDHQEDAGLDGGGKEHHGDRGLHALRRDHHDSKVHLGDRAVLTGSRKFRRVLSIGVCVYV